MSRVHRLRLVARSAALGLGAVALSAAALVPGAAAQTAGAASANAAPATPASPLAQGRIVGGSPASVRDSPWQVSVWSRGGPDGGWDCGGSIIGPSTIVTAAHCVDGSAVGTDPNGGGLGITAGISHLDIVRIGDQPQDRTVKTARLHPQWSPAVVRTAGDLAVLTLETPLVLDGITAAAIALPPDTPLGNQPALVGADVHVTGFGRQSGTTQPDGQLYALNASVDHPTVCPAEDNAAALCVRTPSGAACSGDSGGPLVTLLPTPVLVGVVSNGPSTCPLGGGDSYVNLLAPENRRFIAGEASPPIAPRLTAELVARADGGMTVGQMLTCSASFTGSNVSRLWTVRRGDGTVLATGDATFSFNYRMSEADLGQQLSCEVSAWNAGGVAVDGPISTPGAVRAATRDTPRPLPVAPKVFRLGEAAITASSAKTVKRGKVLKVTVDLVNLFSAADTGSICVKQGAAQPKCVTADLKNKTNAKVAFRFRIAKKARPKSLLSFAVTAALAGRNPNSNLVEQTSRSTTVRARVSR